LRTPRYKTDSAAKLLIFKEFSTRDFARYFARTLDLSSSAARSAKTINKVIHRMGDLGAKLRRIKDLAAISETHLNCRG
jgi:uncharacterized protein Yka (UPF0111/DUF47 family)